MVPLNRSILLASAVAILVVAIAFFVWKESHDAKVWARAQYEAQVEFTKVLKEEREKIKASEKKEVAEVRKQDNLPVTRIVQEIPKYIPIQIQLEKPKDETGKPVPDAPSQAVLQGPADESLKALWSFTQTCRECQVKLEHRDEEVANLEKQLAAKDEEAKALKKAKGGFWVRAKWFIVGGTVGAVAGMAAAR